MPLNFHMTESKKVRNGSRRAVLPATHIPHIPHLRYLRSQDALVRIPLREHVGLHCERYSCESFLTTQRNKCVIDRVARDLDSKEKNGSLPFKSPILHQTLFLPASICVTCWRVQRTWWLGRHAMQVLRRVHRGEVSDRRPCITVSCICTLVLSLGLSHLTQDASCIDSTDWYAVLT